MRLLRLIVRRLLIRVIRLDYLLVVLISIRLCDFGIGVPDPIRALSAPVLVLLEVLLYFSPDVLEGLVG